MDKVWTTIINYVYQEVGFVGVIALGLCVVIAYMYRESQKQNKEHVAKIESQAEQCRQCHVDSARRYRELDEKHDKRIQEYYKTQREENNRFVDRMETANNRVADALGQLNNATNLLIGRIDH